MSGSGIVVSWNSGKPKQGKTGRKRFSSYNPTTGQASCFNFSSNTDAKSIEAPKLEEAHKCTVVYVFDKKKDPKSLKSEANKSKEVMNGVKVPKLDGMKVPKLDTKDIMKAGFKELMKDVGKKKKRKVGFIPYEERTFRDILAKFLQAFDTSEICAFYSTEKDFNVMKEAEDLENGDLAIGNDDGQIFLCVTPSNYTIRRKAVKQELPVLLLSDELDKQMKSGLPYYSINPIEMGDALMEDVPNAELISEITDIRPYEYIYLPYTGPD